MNKSNNFLEECREIAFKYNLQVEESERIFLWEGKKLKMCADNWDEMYSYLIGYDEAKSEVNDYERG